MGGKFSRTKGRRGEQQLVLHLARLGYKAERILRQYQVAGQPDVRACKGEDTFTFEMKSRKNSFKSIYDLYYSERDQNGFLGFALLGRVVAVDTSLSGLFTKDVHFRYVGGVDKKKLRVFDRIVCLAEAKQSADFLVIKDNNKPKLFIRYW